MGVENSAQHLSGLIYSVCNMARVVSQHTLLYDAESPRLSLHFFILLLHELRDGRKDFIPSLGS